MQSHRSSYKKSIALPHVNKHRVVVTGLGVVAPNGIGIDEFWGSLITGKSGIGPITLFNAAGFRSQIAGEVKNFHLSKYVDGEFKSKRMARHTQLALAATQLALSDSQYNCSECRGPLPVYLGISSSAFDLIEKGMRQLQEKGPQFVTHHVVRSSPPQTATCMVSEMIKTQGADSQAFTFSTSCAAGLDAIAAATESIRSGKTDVAIAGGVDSEITPTAFATFIAAGLACTQNQYPERASRPFDLGRETGVISEGAGVVILESLDHARARNAKIYLEVTGYGTFVDSEEPGSGLFESMQQALSNAGKNPQHIRYVCAHGAGHPVLDRTETMMIKKLFGLHAYKVPVSSIKGVIGNPLAAAGPLQVITCALAFKHNLIPPTANYEKPDPTCDLDYVPNNARMSHFSSALINAHGIGGGNSSLVVEKVV